MSLIHLVYASDAGQTLGEAQLNDIVARTHHAGDGASVTGMLVHKDGHCLHLLEGQSRVVQHVYNTIRRDPRHREIQTIMVRYVDERTFDDQPVLYLDLDEAKLHALPAFTYLTRGRFDAIAFAENPLAAYQFITALRVAGQSG